MSFISVADSYRAEFLVVGASSVVWVRWVVTHSDDCRSIFAIETGLGILLAHLDIWWNNLRMGKRACLYASFGYLPSMAFGFEVK